MSADKVTDSKVTIKIPRILYNKLATIVSGSGFNSVTDFIIYILRDLVSASNISDKSENSSLSKEEINAIRKRLKSLGYL
jgi:hypothetical protein